MNRSYRILPIYTGDVSGVCSALFELGGMVVMHDPSGCNSTYNTHDELRWYDHDSLIFISGLNEMDAILGNDDKLIEDIVTAAEELKPRFIALASAPIPYMNGTDFDGICREIESLTGISTFFVKSNGAHDYTFGAGNALAEIAERFVTAPARKRPHTVNLLGATPLDFGTQDTVNAMKRQLTDNGWEVLSCWAMGDTLDTISRSAEAVVNLVVSAVGLKAAKILEKKFAIPYVVGCPIGDFTSDLCTALDHAERTTQSCNALDQNLDFSNDIVTLIGEPVVMGSFGHAIAKKYGISYRLLCPLENCETLLRKSDCSVKGEEEMDVALRSSGIVIADPLYHPICPENTVFYELPHVGFSGRCFRRKLFNLFDCTI